jgi:hypothetical protein
VAVDGGGRILVGRVVDAAEEASEDGTGLPRRLRLLAMTGWVREVRSLVLQLPYGFTQVSLGGTSRREGGVTPAHTSLRGGVADVAIQRFWFSLEWCGGRVVRGWNWIAASATPPRNDGGRCGKVREVRSLVLQFPYGFRRLSGWRSGLSGRRRYTSPYVIARRRSRRGNPEVLVFAGVVWRKSSQRMELDCRVGCASSQ